MGNSVLIFFSIFFPLALRHMAQIVKVSMSVENIPDFDREFGAIMKKLSNISELTIGNTCFYTMGGNKWPFNSVRLIVVRDGDAIAILGPTIALDKLREQLAQLPRVSSE